MEREQIFRVTLNKFLKPVALFLADPAITEVMINGAHEIYIERDGLLEKTAACFADEDTLLSAARNIAQYTNKRITPLTARLDSRLPDGSRVHMVFPRCSRQGLCLAIRKFASSSFTLAGLVEMGALTPAAKEYLEIIIGLEKNLIVSGGTGAGKTSLLNALSAEIPATARVIVIEDSSELQLQQPHVLSFETASADRHGEGSVSIRELFHSALRMRPDRIIIGECRGGEALDLIQALTSGHAGSMSTLHANTAADALHRLETMALMSGLEMPLFALRAQIASAIDVVVQLTRRDDGRRLITEISEVGALSSNGQYGVTPIFELAEPPAQAHDHALGELSWTGKQSAFGNYLKQKGLHGRARLTREIFLRKQS
jgi:pilus assembly protein CpaF